jgi:hypothetical protein
MLVSQDKENSETPGSSAIWMTLILLLLLVPLQERIAISDVDATVLP